MIVQPRKMQSGGSAHFSPVDGVWAGLGPPALSAPDDSVWAAVSPPACSAPDDPVRGCLFQWFLVVGCFLPLDFLVPAPRAPRCQSLLSPSRLLQLLVRWRPVSPFASGVGRKLLCPLLSSGFCLAFAVVLLLDSICLRPLFCLWCALCCSCPRSSPACVVLLFSLFPLRAPFVAPPSSVSCASFCCLVRLCGPPCSSVRVLLRQGCVLVGEPRRVGFSSAQPPLPLLCALWCCPCCPGLRHPVALVTLHIVLCRVCDQRRTSLLCLLAPRWCDPPHPARLILVCRAAFPSPWCLPLPRSLRPRISWAGERGTWWTAERGLMVPATGPRQGGGAQHAPRRTHSGLCHGIILSGSLRRQSWATCAAVACLVWTRSIMRPVFGTNLLLTGDSAGALGLFVVDATTSSLGSATPAFSACLRVLLFFAWLGGPASRARFYAPDLSSGRSICSPSLRGKLRARVAFSSFFCVLSSPSCVCPISFLRPSPPLSLAFCCFLPPVPVALALCCYYPPLPPPFFCLSAPAFSLAFCFYWPWVPWASAPLVPPLLFLVRPPPLFAPPPGSLFLLSTCPLLNLSSAGVVGLLFLRRFSPSPFSFWAPVGRSPVSIRACPAPPPPPPALFVAVVGPLVLVFPCAPFVSAHLLAVGWRLGLPFSLLCCVFRGCCRPAAGLPLFFLCFPVSAWLLAVG